MSECRVICGDALEVLPTLAEKIDAVVTDPPYGIEYRNKRGDIRPVTYSGPIAGDDSGRDGQAIIDWSFATDLPVCAFSHHRSPWFGEWRQFLVWDKGGAVGGGGDRATCWKFTWEVIQVGGFGVLNGQRDEAVLRFPISQQDMPDHPTQKPVDLMVYLIKKLTHPGATVLDPFCGSGTTGVACAMTGRNFIGIEIDPKYCEIARRRIAEAAPLFRQAEATPDPSLFPVASPAE